MNTALRASHLRTTVAVITTLVAFAVALGSPQAAAGSGRCRPVEGKLEEMQVEVPTSRHRAGSSAAFRARTTSRCSPLRKRIRPHRASLTSSGAR